MRKLLFSIFAILPLLLLSSVAAATCHVITPAGSGTGSGSDWNNACHGFTGNCGGMVRGDSYYLGKGTYASPSLSTANSGSLTITIKSPTAGDHCTDTGFNQSTHVGQAVLQGQLNPSTDFWILDGQYGTQLSKGSYGIKVQYASGSQYEIFCTTGCSNSTFRFLEIQGSNDPNVCDNALQVNGWNHAGGNPQNIALSHTYMYQMGGIKFGSVDNPIFEYSVTAENFSSGSCHGENVALNSTSNFIVRYNKFVNCVGTACIADPSATTETSSNIQIYGNVFYNDLTKGACENKGGTGPCLDNGIITILGGGTYNGIKIYNNTVANWVDNQLNANSLNFFANFSGGSVSGMDMENNLFYNNLKVQMGASGTCLYNSFYSTPLSSTPCPGDQTNGAGNPFVNSTSDFLLTADTSGWSALASPYNLDPAGVIRTTSRGAYQFGGASSALPSPPSGLTASVQ